MTPATKNQRRPPRARPARAGRPRRHLTPAQRWVLRLASVAAILVAWQIYGSLLQTLQTMQKYKVLTGTAPAGSTLVDTAPITAVIHKLGAWTGDPRWH